MLLKLSIELQQALIIIKSLNNKGLALIIKDGVIQVKANGDVLPNEVVVNPFQLYNIIKKDGVLIFFNNINYKINPYYSNNPFSTNNTLNILLLKISDTLKNSNIEIDTESGEVVFNNNDEDFFNILYDSLLNLHNLNGTFYIPSANCIYSISDSRV